MAIVHSGVATVCTASHLTNWHIPGLGSDDPKTNVNTKLQTVNELIALGFKRDFALLEVIITDTQRKANKLDDFLPKIGFKLVFEGSKGIDKTTQRHQETGDLSAWMTDPATYEKSLVSYKEELIALKDKIDPPKKPDPKRLAIEDLKWNHLVKAGMIQPNSKVANPLCDILLVKPEVFLKFVKIKYGMDITRQVKTASGDWTRVTTRQLKDAHTAWKNELF